MQIIHMFRRKVSKIHETVAEYTIFMNFTYNYGAKHFRSYFYYGKRAEDGIGKSIV